jgi:PAS domain S-box-containing protein
MTEQVLFSKIPTPALIINKITSAVLVNPAFENLVGYQVSNMNQLSMVGFQELNLENIADNNYEFDRFIFNNKKEQILLQCKLTQLNSEQFLITLEKNQANIKTFLGTNFSNITFEDIPNILIISNLKHGESVWFSPNIQLKTGYTAEELKTIGWSNLTYSEDIELQKSASNSILYGLKRSYQIDKRIVAKNGRIIWTEEFGKIYSIDNERYLLNIIRENSAEKEIETELNRAKQKVEEAEKLKSAFLDNMPHEIRTPLHAITGFTSLLSDVNLTTEERIEYVKFIQDSSNDILNLIDNIIEIAKLETNQVKPKRERCYINSVIDHLYEDIRSKQKNMGKDAIELKVIKSNADPAYMIFSDSERIFHIIGHLLNNALKFTDMGSIEFGYLPEKNGKIEFFVKDTGIGIPKDQQNIIFQKFGKSGNINTDKNRGTGLGLTLAKRYIELLNGDIQLKSEIGKGSTFTFTIPVEADSKITISKPSVYGELNWNAKTILVAEDTESNYFFIEAFLERTNVNLLWAQDGREAIELFREHGENISLILMDIMMPEIDGFDATREIKKMDPNVPIIAQTALALPDDEDKCYEVGCDYVLVKPINSEDLIATIKRFIR